MHTRHDQTCKTLSFIKVKQGLKIKTHHLRQTKYSRNNMHLETRYHMRILDTHKQLRETKIKLGHSAVRKRSVLLVCRFFCLFGFLWFAPLSQHSLYASASLASLLSIFLHVLSPCLASVCETSLRSRSCPSLASPLSLPHHPISLSHQSQFCSSEPLRENPDMSFVVHTLNHNPKHFLWNPLRERERERERQIL